MTGKITVNGTTYYLNEDGSRAFSGWFQDASTWYYLDGNGHPRTGWIKLEDKWYNIQTVEDVEKVVNAISEDRV